MQKFKRALIIAFALSAAWYVGTPSSAQANHSFTIVSIRDVQAYRHLLETDDRLLLVRYALTEIPGPSEDPIGPNGAIIKALDGAILLQQIHPPTVGYALGAFYWDAASSSAVPWLGAGIDVCIEENPTLFASPQSHCIGSVLWNSTVDLDATKAALESDLPAVMQLLEQDDPDIQTREYITPSGITLLGRTVVEDAFPQLVSIGSGVFTISQSSVGGDFLNPTPVPGSFGDTTASDAANSRFSSDVRDFGEAFGVPFTLSGLIVIVIAFVGLFFAVRVTGGDREVLVLFAGPVLLFGGLIGAPPFSAVVALFGLIFILGTAAIINRHWPG